MRINKEGVEFAVRGVVPRADASSCISYIDDRQKIILRGVRNVAEISLRQIIISIMPSRCCQVTHFKEVEASQCVVVLTHSTKENKDEANQRGYRESERSEYACYTPCLHHLCYLGLRSAEADTICERVAVTQAKFLHEEGRRMAFVDMVWEIECWKRRR